MKQVLTNAIRRGTHGGGMFWEGEPRDIYNSYIMNMVEMVSEARWIYTLQSCSYEEHGDHEGI
jgi:hypothetical protein